MRKGKVDSNISPFLSSFWLTTDKFVNWCWFETCFVCFFQLDLVPLYASKQTSRSLSVLSLSVSLSISVRSHKHTHKPNFPLTYTPPLWIPLMNLSESERYLCDSRKKRMSLCRYWIKLDLIRFRQSLYSLLI